MSYQKYDGNRLGVKKHLGEIAVYPSLYLEVVINCLEVALNLKACSLDALHLEPVACYVLLSLVPK